MHREQRSVIYAALLLALAPAPLGAASFVYEGQLDDHGAPANGRYDIQLAVYRDAALGASVDAPVVFSAVDVSNGRFRLEFDARIDGSEHAWVEVAVRDAGSTRFSAIPGRTKAMQAPAAIGACWSSIGDSGSNPATHFLGTTDAQPLVLRTRNAQSLRIEPSAELFAGSPITANVIAGSSANGVTAGVRGATISGGGVPTGDSDPIFTNEAPNRVTDAYGTVGGGFANRAGDDAGTALDQTYATVGGGSQNIARDGSTTVAGGTRNSAIGFASTVGGGLGNSAQLLYSTVGGGTDNAAFGFASVVGGGQLNCAGGNNSWAGGKRAKVRPQVNPGGTGACSGLTYPGGSGDEGSFVWADSSQNADFVSTSTNQFLIRAEGGMAVNTNDPAGSDLRVNGTVRVDGTLRVDTLGTFSAGSPTLCRNIGNQIALCSSSRRYKDDIADLPPSLDAVLALRPVSYQWKVTGVPDIGFVAEEVAELDERLITRNDNGEIEGVKYERLSALLASAVQEMAAREQLQAREIDDLRKDLAELRTLIETQRTGDR
ncbi:MAG: tail fiber domain-containing protein [Rhodanobacteraceae bacterium]|nr:tail fiber domain-containing protein [Rhodanobacteraceae bacterium]